MRRLAGSICLAFGLVRVGGAPGWAAEGALSNYVPGFYGDFGMAFLPETGTYANNWLSYNHSHFNLSVPGLPAKLEYHANTVVEAPGFIHVPETPVLGGHFGVAAFLPIMFTELAQTTSAPGFTQESNWRRGGLGDAYLVPAGMLWGAGDFNVVVYEGIVVPTGSYQKTRLLNTGRNYWSFDSTAGFTWFDARGGHEFSTMIGYMTNTENTATDYRSGDEFHLDYLLGQYLTNTFAIGATGSFYKQVTGDSGDGAVLGGFLGRGSSIGPALLVSVPILGTAVTFTTKWLHEFEVKNRFEGDYVYLLAAFHL